MEKMQQIGFSPDGGPAAPATMIGDRIEQRKEH
jgi:hypothetical protein